MQTDIKQNKFLKAMGIIHSALLAGVCMFLVMAVVLVQLNGGALMAKVTQDLMYIFYAIVYFAALATAGFGNIIFERNMRNAKLFTMLKPKIDTFKSAYMIRMALAEGPAFVSIGIYMLTGSWHFLPATALCLMLMFMSKPTQDFVAEKLYLNPEEKEQLLTI
ncbi:MAG: hypothetical protein M0D57_06760 [Sphingobacteriales bacterium JAD_PAG50586_3]|nr:MAG: hypothetical protein M0D57_06760 [Sphingobacteriales bacterium JAD_PAG50586_3]